MSEPSTAASAGRSAALRTVSRGVGRWAARLAVVLAGAWLGILLLGRVSAPIGPFDATVAFRPFGGGAALDIPPLGALQADGLADADYPTPDRCGWRSSSAGSTRSGRRSWPPTPPSWTASSTG